MRQRTATVHSPSLEGDTLTPKCWGLPHCILQGPWCRRALEVPQLPGGSGRAGRTPPRCRQRLVQRGPGNMSKALCAQLRVPARALGDRQGWQEHGKPERFASYFCLLAQQQSSWRQNLGDDLPHPGQSCLDGPLSAGAVRAQNKHPKEQSSSDCVLLPPQHPVETDTPHQGRVCPPTPLPLALPRGHHAQHEVPKHQSVANIIWEGSSGIQELCRAAGHNSGAGRYTNSAFPTGMTRTDSGHPSGSGHSNQTAFQFSSQGT